jgi:hypothetical protein
VDELARELQGTADEHSEPLRVALFGTTDPESIAAVVAGFVASALCPIATPRFVRSGVGLVAGLELVDGRGVVVKVHRWNVTQSRLLAVHRVQQHLAGAGLPVPRPLVPPTPMGRGLATVEEMRSGRPADGHRPEIRRALAVGLADFVHEAGRMSPTPRVGRGFLGSESGDRLWGEPHDVRFDFDATREGAEWIDEVARWARRRCAKAQLPDVVAHLDWRVQNVGFADDGIVAVYDWDSVGLAPEAVAVGQAAAQFSTDWAGVGWSSLPSPAEMRAFVGDYEQHRGTRFDPGERTVIDASNLLLLAYGSRCEHSDRRLRPDLAAPPGAGWAALLQERRSGPPL